MNHQPTQLALLISLIGIGAAPHANASASISALLDTRASDALALGAIQPLPGVACDELEVAALPVCGANTELTWLPPRDPLDRTSTAGVRVLYSTVAREDWAPGEASAEPARFGHWAPHESAGQAAKARAEAREPSRQGSRKSSAKAADQNAEKHVEERADKTTRKVRVLAQVPASARVKMPAFVQGDAAIERIERLIRVAQVGEADSKQADRPLEGLVAVRHGARGTSLAESPSAPTATAAEPRPPDVAPLEIARVQAPVDLQSSRVLRQLGAILAEERDEVGAVRHQESQAVVTTQTGKVLGMLGEIVAAQPLVEDGPARRLRKLAARAAKADASAAADAAAALAAEVAHAGVDLMLPLEPPAFVAAPPADGGEARPSTEPAALPLLGTQLAAAPAPSAPATRPARTSPFGDRPVALADTSLDRVRGGFSVDGLSISFGIERAVYVNGALVTTTSLNVSDLGRITAGRGTTAFDAGTIGLIQSGAGNVVSPTMISAGSVGTVIQNTLDGQKIQNVTIINATTNSLGLLKSINLQSSLRGAVIDSLRR